MDLRRFWKALGTRPATVPWADVGAALRAGDIDVLPTHRAHLYPLKFCRHLRFVSLLGDVPPVLSVAVNEAKFQILRPDTQNALLDACDQAGDFFSAHVRKAEAENEALNIAGFKAAYLKVALDPWHAAVQRVRQNLLAEGLLDAETVAAAAGTVPEESDPTP